ncbi:PPIase CWC27 [Intoshia linei]|uniref:Spliceosome-associated protein CWC27 homolog n=1 Tax=Intoshia linei TaxID=1819745 RepID=A0A177BAG6_9BILA|nr:PPIase CWC27 [Intoshia linei]
MSSVYVTEPATNGKILMVTTAGDIDIELWPKEAPMACRNFIQLGLEGYYDNTIFHRVEKNFIVQGGDPSGSGFGGESIYGKPFKDEFHSRLKFSRRGMLGMANSGKHDNNSQFFFTLNAANGLNNKNTLFGKITGNTIFNMLRIPENVEYVKNGNNRPVDPHHIIKIKILKNPFDDIVIRNKKNTDIQVIPSKPVKRNKNLLSFAVEEEEIKDSETKGCISSHDILSDAHLSKEAVQVGIPANFKKSNYSKVEKIDEDSPHMLKLRKKRHADIREIQRELLAKKALTQEQEKGEHEHMVNNLALLESKEKFRYKFKSTQIRKQSASEREKNNLHMLEQFESLIKMNSALSSYAATKDSDDEDAGNTKGDDMSWLKHQLIYLEPEDKGLNANVYEIDRYHLSDPKHPTNRHRRGDFDKNV